MLGRISRYYFEIIIIILALTNVLISIYIVATVFAKETHTTFTSGESVEKAVNDSTHPERIFIDVSGAVLKPGLYALKKGSRLSEALNEAGGLAHNAAQEYVQKTYNRAQILVDEDKVYIPSQEEIDDLALNEAPTTISDVGEMLPPTTHDTQQSSHSVSSNLIHINTSPKATLEDLPGVGPVTAQKIIEGRPYMSIEELQSKEVVGSALFTKIKELVTL